MIYSFIARLFLYYFLLLVKALIVLNDIIIHYLVQRHTFQKIYKSYQTNECCRHETVKKIKLPQYDQLRSESTISSTTALIFKRTIVVLINMLRV